MQYNNVISYYMVLNIRKLNTSVAFQFISIRNSYCKVIGLKYNYTEIVDTMLYWLLSSIIHNICTRAPKLQFTDIYIYINIYIHYVHAWGMASMHHASGLIGCLVHIHMNMLDIKQLVDILSMCTQYHYIPLLYKQKNTHWLCYAFCY